MRYRVGVEDMAPGWAAWVLDLPGVVGRGETPEAAVADVPARIAAYHDWRSAHGRPLPPDNAPATVEVVARFQSYIGTADAVVNAFFADDRRPLSPVEIADALWQLDALHEELLARIDQRSPLAPALARFVDGLALAEWWDLDRLGKAVPRDTLPTDPLAKLDAVPAEVRAVLPALAGDDAVVTADGEEWSPRKVMRWLIWNARRAVDDVADVTDAAGGHERG